MSTASAERTTDRRSTTPMDVGKGSLKDRQEIDKPSFAKTSTLLKAFRYYIIRMISCPVPGLPSFIPIIGGKTAVELVATAAIIVIGTLSSGTSGKAADYLGAVTILLCMRHNILTLVFGISFERGNISIAIKLLSINTGNLKCLFSNFLAQSTWRYCNNCDWHTWWFAWIQQNWSWYSFLYVYCRRFILY